MILSAFQPIWRRKHPHQSNVPLRSARIITRLHGICLTCHQVIYIVSPVRIACITSYAFYLLTVSNAFTPQDLHTTVLGLRSIAFSFKEGLISYTSYNSWLIIKILIDPVFAALYPWAVIRYQKMYVKCYIVSSGIALSFEVTSRIGVTIFARSIQHWIQVLITIREACTSILTAFTHRINSECSDCSDYHSQHK